ncbi:M48 family metalloprotease [Aquimarina pacifica]|uniref:M48 family metalloprotease n=1 Tax=Aquimarina pacifica TaxID=1296415 RepID=UPI00046EB7D6|nr:M48 family metallopeptidase [Aquimarina pacifica]
MVQKNIKLSSQFRVQTTKAIMAIVVFILVYLLILTFAIALTAVCIYFGALLVITYPRLITIALGIGLASLGVLILFFLIKFVFKSNKVDRSHFYEVNRKDEPKLFTMIDEIVEVVGTKFPKRVYVSKDVNASVFYDSSFWSMFFPVKKNLHIGLGLVNSTHKEELKAILAHEFGHFSQRSMKVGSYVYNVNQVIFNMLYDNEAYDKTIQGWANASGYFSIFVVIALLIIQAIQKILQVMYEFVNKSYLALSREMEFHADEIAANVTGYEPLKNALLRMNLADYSFSTVLSYYEGKIPENVVSNNIFIEHEYLINFMAKEDNIPVLNNLPAVSLEDLNKFNKSKLEIEDQWTSHPSTEDRIKRLEATNSISKQSNNGIANDLFNNVQKTQERITKETFKDIKYSETPTINSLENFKIEFNKEFKKNTFSKVFNGYYDAKNLMPFDINASKFSESKKSYEDLFSDQNVDMIYNMNALEHDIENIKQIAYKTVKIKTFDYDGVKYKQKEGNSLIIKLNEELASLKEKIKQNDIDIFYFFEGIERNKNSTNKIKELYSNFFDFEKEYSTKIEFYTNLSNKLQFVNFAIPFDEIKSNFRKIKPFENELKEGIRQVLNTYKFPSEITKEARENFELFLSKDWEYFGNEKYFDDQLTVLFTSLSNFEYLLSRAYFLHKKELLDYKVVLLKETVPHLQTL